MDEGHVDVASHLVPNQYTPANNVTADAGLYTASTAPEVAATPVGSAINGAPYGFPAAPVPDGPDRQIPDFTAPPATPLVIRMPIDWIDTVSRISNGVRYILSFALHAAAAVLPS